MLLPILILTFAIFLMILGIRANLKDNLLRLDGIVRIAISSFLIGAILFTSIFVVNAHIHNDVELKKLNLKREEIGYLVKNGIPANVKINNYNNKILNGRELQSSIFIGWYYNYIDWYTVPLIEYKEVN